MPPLNLFYSEPDFDRWLPLDRWPRRLVRRIVRGPTRPGGQMRVFLNLMAGLDRLGVSYRRNDYRHARSHPDELCCVLGKRHVLDLEPWRNPLMVGPCVHDHPIDDPDLFRRRRVRRILVPGPWMRRMCEPYWNGAVHAWPVGIDTEDWKPDPAAPKDIDFLIYNKVRWEPDQRESSLVGQIRHELGRRNLKFVELRYGHYQPDELRNALRRARAMVFLCEHETQGIAYQQALSAGVPLLAWDHGGEWLDPSYYPERIHFGPVSSVPYWDERCGVRFAAAEAFPSALERLEELQHRGTLEPRAFVLENLTLERCAASFIAHAQAAADGVDLTS